MRYYLYHIPGKKVGVTCDIQSRIKKQQGYKDGEFEIIEHSDDIDYISRREIELQKYYGYRIEEQLYRDLILTKKKTMTINITEQTTTFSVPVAKLKEALIENLGMEIDNPNGVYYLTVDLAEWIINNACRSLYNEERCYVYNRSLQHYMEGKIAPKLEFEPEVVVEEETIFNKIRHWAQEKGILDNGDVKTQYIKLQEESGELAKAILKDDEEEFIDAIGDMVVVLTNLAALNDMKIEDCIQSAYDVIKNRQGSMQNGTFVKEQPSTNTIINENTNTTL